MEGFYVSSVVPLGCDFREFVREYSHQTELLMGLMYVKSFSHTSQSCSSVVSVGS
jgi:hypothetical protein